MKDLSKVYELRNLYNNKVIEKLENELGNIIYEAWKRLTVKDIPPLTLPKCKGVDLVDYKIYGESKQGLIKLPGVQNLNEWVKETSSSKYYYLDDFVNGKKQLTISYKHKLHDTTGSKEEAMGYFYFEKSSNNFTSTSTVYLLASKTIYNFEYTFYIKEGERYRLMWLGAENLFQNIYDIELKSIPTPEIPASIESVGEYDETTNKYKIPIKTRSKNLMPINSYVSDSIWAKKIIDMEPLLKYIKCGKTYTISADFICEKALDVVNSGTLGFQFVKGTAPTTMALTIGYQIAEREVVHLKKSFALPSDTTVDSYVGLWAYMNYSNDTKKGAGGRIENIQIEEGTEETEFEPYVEPITTNIYLEEPLRKIGDYADYIDFKNQKVYRKIYREFISSIFGKSSLSGDYTIFLSEIEKKPFLTIKQDAYQGYAISNKFKQHTGAYGTLIKNLNSIQSYITSAGLNRVAYTFGDASIKTVEQAKEIISDGFEVYYVLDEQIPEDIELPNIQTHNGTTIIEVDTNINASNMDVVYLGKNKMQTLNEEDNAILNSIIATNTKTELDISDNEINRILDEIIGGLE